MPTHPLDREQYCQHGLLQPLVAGVFQHPCRVFSNLFWTKQDGQSHFVVVEILARVSSATGDEASLLMNFSNAMKSTTGRAASVGATHTPPAMLKLPMTPGRQAGDSHHYGSFREA
jgi:hypothetical protein